MTIKINKIDAARHQVETAITMLFSGMDDISIYTLIMAAGTVLRNLCEQNNKISFVDIMIKLEHKKDYINHMNRAANFFKHADRDPNAILEWNKKEELNDSVILEACFDYETVTGSVTWPMQYFLTWFALSHPNWIKAGARAAYDTSQAAAFRAASRQQKLELGLQGLQNPPSTWIPHTFR